jgi:hypothetical protein
LEGNTTKYLDCCRYERINSCCLVRLEEWTFHCLKVDVTVFRK